MDFLNWAPRRPIGRGECSRMDQSTGAWIDTDCMDVYGHVCKFPLGESNNDFIFILEI